jgi:arsenite-transporting ATPase
VRNQTLLINGVFHATDREDPVARAREESAKKALAMIPENLGRLPRREIPLRAWSPVGITGLRALLDEKGRPQTSTSPLPAYQGPELKELVEEIAQRSKGVVLTMGKGGVGKTTVAATVAVELARRGHNVLLTTTDPAAHVSEAVKGKIPHLEIAKIDPREEVRLYKEEVMATAGADLDEQGRAVLEEDLRSPCTEEIAVFRAFARTVARGEEQFVVIDTAPTGHTILLLDAAEAYHKEVLKKPGSSPQAVRDLLPHLRDPEFTRVLLVTLPEATPVHEAVSLESDLERAGIHPFAWVVNQSLSPLKVTDPVLLSRQASEAPYLKEVAERAQRYAVEPWRVEGSPVLNKQELSKA